jgi:hypothetical protein
MSAFVSRISDRVKWVPGSLGGAQAPDAVVRRYGAELLFAVESKKRRGSLGKLLG